MIRYHLLDTNRYMCIYIIFYTIFQSTNYIKALAMRTSSHGTRSEKSQDSAPEVFDEGAANAKNLGKPGLSVA